VSRHKDDALIAAFVARLHEAAVAADEPVPTALPTPPAALADLYAVIPSRLPPLLERLLLAYRWPEVDVGPLRLFANPPGTGLQGFRDNVLRDPCIWKVVSGQGWIPIGLAPALCYDPVCLAIQRGAGRDCPVVQLDHEEILCNLRVRPVAELARSFRGLIAGVVDERG
jgi:hypothetical protein